MKSVCVPTEFFKKKLNRRKISEYIIHSKSKYYFMKLCFILYVLKQRHISAGVYWITVKKCISYCGGYNFKKLKIYYKTKLYNLVLIKH